MNAENPNFFASRHSERSFGNSPDPEYPGLTELGVEIARQQASIIVDIIKETPERGVVALCGTSEAPRTKSTAKVYTEAVEQEITKQGIDCFPIDKSELKFENGPTAELAMVSDSAKQHPDSKIFFSMPLFIKQFKIGGNRWQNEDGTWTSKYAENLFKNADFDIQKIVEQLGEDYRAGVEGAVNPEALAKEQLMGIQRLQDFLVKIFPEREITVGFVGHSPNLEILAQYLSRGEGSDLQVAFPEAGIMRVKFGDDSANLKLPE